MFLLETSFSWTHIHTSCHVNTQKHTHALFHPPGNFPAELDWWHAQRSSQSCWAAGHYCAPFSIGNWGFLFSVFGALAGLCRAGEQTLGCFWLHEKTFHKLGSNVLFKIEIPSEWKRHRSSPRHPGIAAI